MSESLVWHLIRDNNSFMVKRERTRRSGQVMFSKEAGNIMSVNTFKYSGVANKRNIDIAASGQTLTTNVDKTDNKPSANKSFSDMKTYESGMAALATLEKSGYRNRTSLASPWQSSLWRYGSRRKI